MNKKNGIYRMTKALLEWSQGVDVVTAKLKWTYAYTAAWDAYEKDGDSTDFRSVIKGVFKGQPDAIGDFPSFPD